MKNIVQILSLLTLWSVQAVIGSAVVAISPIVREVEAKKSLYYFKKGQSPSSAASRNSGAQTEGAEDRIFFPPYKFPFWGLPYGVHSNGGFFNPGLFPFVPGGPGFPPYDGVFGGPKGPGAFPGSGPNPFGPVPGAPDPSAPVPPPAPPAKKKPKPKPKKPKYVPKDECDCGSDYYDEEDDYDCSCSKPVKEKYVPKSPPPRKKPPPPPSSSSDCSYSGSKGPRCKDSKPKYPKKEPPKRACKYGFYSGSRGGCKPPPAEEPEDEEEEYTPRCKNYGKKRCRSYKSETTTASYEDEDEYETATPAPQQQQYLPVVFAYQPATSPAQPPPSPPQPQQPPVQYSSGPSPYDPSAPFVLQYTQQSAEQANQNPVMMYYTAQPQPVESQNSQPPQAPSPPQAQIPQQQPMVMQYTVQQPGQPPQQPQILQYSLQASPPQPQPQIMQYTVQGPPPQQQPQPQQPQPQVIQYGPNTPVPQPQPQPQIMQYITMPPQPVQQQPQIQYQVTSQQPNTYTAEVGPQQPQANYQYATPAPPTPMSSPVPPPPPPSPVKPYEMMQYGHDQQYNKQPNIGGPMPPASAPSNSEMIASQSINNMHSPMLPYEIIYEPPGPSQYVYTPKMRYRYPGFQRDVPSAVPLQYDILEGETGIRPNPIFDLPSSSKNSFGSKNYGPKAISDKISEGSDLSPQKIIKNLGIFDHFISSDSSSYIDDSDSDSEIGAEPRSSSIEPRASSKTKGDKDKQKKQKKESLIDNHRTSDNDSDEDEETAAKVTQVISMTKSAPSHQFNSTCANHLKYEFHLFKTLCQQTEAEEEE